MVMANGGTCCFADKNALKGTLLENLQHYKPSRFMGVTRIFEKIEEGIKSKGSDTKGLRKKIVDWAKNQALNHHKQEESGTPHSSLGYTIAKKLIFNKVHVKYRVYRFFRYDSLTGSRRSGLHQLSEVRLCYWGRRCLTGDGQLLPESRHEATGDDQPDGDDGLRPADQHPGARVEFLFLSLKNVFL